MLLLVFCQKVLVWLSYIALATDKTIEPITLMLPLHMVSHVEFIHGLDLHSENAIVLTICFLA